MSSSSEEDEVDGSEEDESDEEEEDELGEESPEDLDLREIADDFACELEE